MRFKIHHGDEDSFIINGDSVEAIQIVMQKEISKRNWKREDCWSEELDP